MAEIVERLRAVRRLDRQTTESRELSLVPDELCQDAAAAIEQKDQIIAGLKEELANAYRNASNAATDYGRRVPMARMYADRIAESIRALSEAASKAREANKDVPRPDGERQ